MASSSTSNSDVPARPPSHRWSLLALAIFAGLVTLSASPGAGWNIDRYARKVLSDEWRRAELLITGDSRVESGLVPEVVARATGRAHVYNAGIPSLSASGLAELLRRFPTNAKEIWVGLSPPMFRAHNREMTTRWFDHGSSPDLPVRLQSWIALRSWIEMRLAARWIRTQAHLQRISPRKSPIAHLHEVVFEHRAPSTSWMHYTPSSGFLAYREPFAGDVAEHLVANSHRYAGSFDERALHALVDRADALRERGIEIVFLRLPVHRRFRSIEAADERFATLVPRTIRAHGHHWIDLSDASGWNYAFLDGHHLLEESARRFTERVERLVGGGALHAALAP